VGQQKIMERSVNRFLKLLFVGFIGSSDWYVQAMEQSCPIKGNFLHFQRSDNVWSKKGASKLSGYCGGLIGNINNSWQQGSVNEFMLYLSYLVDGTNNTSFLNQAYDKEVIVYEWFRAAIPKLVDYCQGEEIDKKVKISSGFFNFFKERNVFSYVALHITFVAALNKKYTKFTVFLNNKPEHVTEQSLMKDGSTYASCFLRKKFECVIDQSKEKDGYVLIYPKNMLELNNRKLVLVDDGLFEEDSLLKWVVMIAGAGKKIGDDKGGSDATISEFNIMFTAINNLGLKITDDSNTRDYYEGDIYMVYSLFPRILNKSFFEEMCGDNRFKYIDSLNDFFKHYSNEDTIKVVIKFLCNMDDKLVHISLFSVKKHFLMDIDEYNMINIFNNSDKLLPTVIARVNHVFSILNDEIKFTWKNKKKEVQDCIKERFLKIIKADPIQEIIDLDAFFSSLDAEVIVDKSVVEPVQEFKRQETEVLKPGQLTFSHIKRDGHPETPIKKDVGNGITVRAKNSNMETPNNNTLYWVGGGVATATIFVGMLFWMKKYKNTPI
jgi:hypothetical protein